MRQPTRTTRSIAAIAGTIMLSACSSFVVDSESPPDRSEVSRYDDAKCKATMTKSVYEDGVAWNACSREAALVSYEYAQMAYNVYEKTTWFDLGPDIKPVETPKETDKGFAYHVYERRRDGVLEEVIISYRGTNFEQWQDWIFGNIGLEQRAAALRVFDDVSARYGVLPSVTGHSLGGALASQVSLCRNVRYNIVFDASPRFSKRFCGKLSYVNHNVSIVEYGEINKLLRIFGRESTQRYVSLNCLKKGGAVDQHSMRKLAACLTNIASLEDDPAAIASRERNKIPNDHELLPQTMAQP